MKKKLEVDERVDNEKEGMEKIGPGKKKWGIWGTVERFSDTGDPKKSLL